MNAGPAGRCEAPFAVALAEASLAFHISISMHIDRP
jgi:hypothetical protein